MCIEHMITGVVVDKQFIWSGHVQRIAEQWIPKLQPEDRRRPGSPTKRWRGYRCVIEPRSEDDPWRNWIHGDLKL